MSAAQDEEHGSDPAKLEVPDSTAHNTEDAEHHCGTWKWISPHQEPKPWCISSGDSFFQHYWGDVDAPKPKVTDDLVEGAQAEAKCMSSDLFRTWARLHAIFGHYSELIRRRWLKKNKTQRQKLLVKA
jgi:hypothetical protein